MANQPKRREVLIKSTHRGLRYVDGRLIEVLEAGRYELPRPSSNWVRRPVVEIAQVDMRERELTIKGQEILTSDKVAVRVSILTQYRVVDPVAAVEKVASYEDRLYSDVQLAARRSLASMTLDEILTNRNQLSEDILADVQVLADSYGVRILRADVKDIVFPGNLQDIMNRVLAAQRLAEAQLVEARTKAERETLDAQTRAETDRIAAASRAESDRVGAIANAETARVAAAARAEVARLDAQAAAEAERIRAEGAAEALRARAENADAYTQHPALLRLQELQSLAALAHNPAARLYIGFDKHAADAVD
ncbi:MAG TPA: slipin family protein [Micromonosporaceae bacterium]|jgi:regulator of protease activity HflC (stomatin/prohibitin superfamily)